MSSTFQFQSIGIIESCYQQKFAIPRQPGLVKQATAKLIFHPEYSTDEIVRGLQEYSHLWIIFVFHKSKMSPGRHTVRLPRLGGERIGVFATRSNFRPNPIGQSVVKLEKISKQENRLCLELSGGDFLDSTPVLDIKPYLPYADIIDNAEAGIAASAPEKCFDVQFTAAAKAQIENASNELKLDVLGFIETLLSYDPRPTHQKADDKYVTRVYGYDLEWRITTHFVSVTSLTRKVSL